MPPFGPSQFIKTTEQEKTQAKENKDGRKQDLVPVDTEKKTKEGSQQSDSDLEVIPFKEDKKTLLRKA